jgi:hypothetical protein
LPRIENESHEGEDKPITPSTVYNHGNGLSLDGQVEKKFVLSHFVEASWGIRIQERSLSNFSARI